MCPCHLAQIGIEHASIFLTFVTCCSVARVLAHPHIKWDKMVMTYLPTINKEEASKLNEPSPAATCLLPEDPDPLTTGMNSRNLPVARVVVS